MNISCTICGYDSGDCSSNTELANKVSADGGYMEMTYDEHGKPRGWEISCPNGCNDEEAIHMD